MIGRLQSDRVRRYGAVGIPLGSIAQPGNVNRRTVEAAVIAALCILAVAVGAATLTSPTTSGEGSGGLFGDGEGDGGLETPESHEDPKSGPSIALPDEFLLVLAAVALLALVGYLFVYWRRVLRLLVVIAVVAAVLLAATLLLLQFVDTSGMEPAPPADVDPPGGDAGGSGGDGDIGSTALTPLAVLSVLVFALVAVALVLFGTSRSPRKQDGGATDSAGGDAAAVGRAAGRAADRLEAGTDTDNEVYRAWREMTELLDLRNPETKAPREFASAAVEAGLDADDVDELTRLFEDVRYGGQAATDEDEQRAIDVFRRIETTYGNSEKGA